MNNVAPPGPRLVESFLCSDDRDDTYISTTPGYRDDVIAHGNPVKQTGFHCSFFFCVSRPRVAPLDLFKECTHTHPNGKNKSKMKS